MRIGRNPRDVGARGRLVGECQGIIVGVEDVSCNERGVTTSEDCEIDHCYCSLNFGAVLAF